MWQSTEHLTYMEVTPVDDIKEHYAGDECWCTPRVENIAGGKPDTMIVHNSADNREKYEGVL